MGETTKLYLNSKIELDDIKDVIENHLKVKVDIESCHTISLGMYHFFFEYKTKRTLTIFAGTDLATRNMIELHLGSNKEAIEIMRKIAEIFGGLLDKNDCNDKGMEEIVGMLDEHDGLPFLLRQAIIENKLKDNDDIKGFKKYIKEWNKRMGS